MTPRPRADRIAKRAEFASAAVAVFAECGVANTAVSDIVKAAGVSQGSFYLYFDTKEEIILAVAEQMVAGMVAAIESAVAQPGLSAVERLLAMLGVLTGFDSDPAAVELTDFIHHPDNRILHDRLTEHLADRLVVLVEEIVAQGVEEGALNVSDTKAAAWFVLAGLQSVEIAGTPAAEMPAAINAVTELALRALGYMGEHE